MANPISWIAAKAAEWVAMTAFQTASATGLSVTTSATIANVAYASTFALVYVGTAVGLSSLASPKVPGAEQGKVPVNQTTPRRRIGTGRARLSGPRAMWESIPGWNIEIINVLDQPIDAFEQFWLNDDEVTVDAEGWVQRLDGAYGDHEIRILAKTGQPGDDGAFEEIVALFAAAGLSDLYDASHRGDGVARIALLCKAVDDRYVLDVYPNGPPALSATARLCRVYDWRDPDQDLMDPATWKWSANAHVNHVHWEWCLRHLPRVDAEGVGWVQGHGPGGVATPPPAICLEDWAGDHAPRLAERTAVADLCDERVALAAGGDEARYEQHGWWEIGTEDADVRAQYLNCYDGWLAEGGDGALIIKGGKYEAPPAGVVLTDRNLVEASWNRGAPDKDVYNIIKATFTSRVHGFSAQPADDWRDEDLIAEIGDEKPLPIDLGWVQSHGQARRLMKRMTPRVFAGRHGDLVADLEGLNHIRRRYGRLERLRGPTSMQSVDFELLGASIDLRGGRVPLNIVMADPNIDAWNPATEEGLGPSLTERAPTIQIPTPEVVSITAVTVSVGDANGVRLRFLIEDPARPGLSFAIRWRAAGVVSWTEESPQPPTAVTGGLQVESGFVQSGDLEASISAWSGGTRSDWTLEQDVSATPDPGGVSPPTNLTVSSPSAGVLRVGYRDPAQPAAYCIVRTNTTATLAGAAATPERPVGGVYTPQSVDLSLPSGSYYVWVTAYNDDDVQSVDVGPVGPVATVPLPVNTVAPAITGSATSGQVLTCSTGTWTNSPTGYAYQWRRGGVAISGATASTRTLTDDDVGQIVTCLVTATNAGGSVSAGSNGVSVTAAKTYADFVAHITGLATGGVQSWLDGTPAGSYRTTPGALSGSMWGSPWIAYFSLGSLLPRVFQHAMPSLSAVNAVISGRYQFFWVCNYIDDGTVTGKSRNGYSSSSLFDGDAALMEMTELIYWDGTRAQRMHPRLGLGPTPYDW